ncbi:b(0,+)-type amino acid transporter 1 [Holothuria leucospilota]|uniref:B(0,+)-type amino acid transporter 1 n=1 Tax=Holothuria leucospilota TaxID=206669 RepID=A0A9Q1BQJ3_HOLLE|nr:b(0,+)-type amino acid transporter 1 [Holothuria leucospilota]
MDHEKVALSRSLGLFHCIGVLAGCIIGTAIFISPAAILSGVNGSVGLSFVIWIASALLGTSEALCFAELGSLFTKSGGEFIYLMESFGPLVAFLRVWSNVVVQGPANAALQTMVIATYVVAPFLGDCHELPWLAVRLLAACAMWLIFFVNCVSVPLAVRIQSFMTVAKITGLVVLILTGMVFLCQGYTDSFREPFQMYSFKLGGLSSAFLAGRYAFAGW